MGAPLNTRREDPHMRAAALLSGGAHLAFVIVAIIGGQLFSSRDTAEFQVAEVSLVPASSFDADISDQLSAAPDAAPDQPETPDVSEAPDQAAPPETAPPPPTPRPVAESAPPEPNETPEDVATLAAPPAPEAPTPPEPVETAEPPQPETPEPPSQPEVAEAPEPDPEEPPVEERVAAPPAPRPRPSRVARTAEADPEPTPEPDPQPTETAEPTEQPARPTAPAEAPVRTGPPLTPTEKEGLIFAIKDCWTPPIALEAAEDLVVTLAVTLSRDGKITAGPTLMEPKPPLSSRHKIAFGAARRALLKCEPFRDLPPDKYAHWRDLEVKFNPEQMVLQ